MLQEKKLKLSFIKTKFIQGIAPVDARKFCAAAYACHLSRELALPSSKVQSGSIYYDDIVQQSALDKIDEFNKAVIIDVTYCLELTKALWLARCDAAYPPATITGVDSVYDFFCVYFGVAFNISPETYMFFTKYRREIMNFSNAIGVIEQECSNES